MTRTTFLKAIAFFLIITLLTGMVPLSHTPVMGNTDSNISDNDEHITSDPLPLGEATDKRDLTTKHFRMNDGSHQAVIYPSPVHYINETGKWEEYDSSLTPSLATVKQITQSNTTEIINTQSKNATAKLNTLQTENPDKIASFNQTNKQTSLAEKAALTLDGKAEIGTIQALRTSVGDKAIAITPYAKDTAMLGYGDGENAVTWGYTNANPNSSAQIETQQTRSDPYTLNTNQEIRYNDIYNDIDLQIFISPNGIKENLILKTPKAQREFEIKYDIGFLIPVQTDDRTIALKNTTGQTIYNISAPYMNDTAGNTSTEITLKIKSNTDGKLTIKLNTDEKWINDKTRQWPIIVDPSFTPESNFNNMSFTYIKQQTPTMSYGPQSSTVMGSVYAGNFSSGGNTETCRTLFKLNTLPQLSPGDVITDARLYMLQNGAAYNGSKFYAHAPTATWTTSNATWNSMASQYNTIALDYARYESSFHIFVLTKQVRAWYDGTAPNYGIMIKAASETESSKLWSIVNPGNTSNRPIFQITYRNNMGLEPYWDYNEIGAGGGISYVNLFSGHYIHVQPLSASTGLLMPISINLIYNIGESYRPYRHGTNGITSSYGKGWKTNYNRMIIPISEMSELSSEIRNKLNQNGYHYVYLDADGTYHYLWRDPNATTNTNKYTDEDGLSLTLTVGNDGDEKYELKSKTGEKETFTTSGMLYRIYDSSNNINYIQCNYTNKNLIRITDGAGRIFRLNYTNDRLTSITEPDGKTTSITYDTSRDEPTTVTYPDGTNTTFTYAAITLNTNTYERLAKITSNDNSYIYTNFISSTTKVSHITEHSTNGTAGNRLTYEYGTDNATKATYSRNDGTGNYTAMWEDTYIFDNWGRTTSILGSDGRMSNTVHAANSVYDSAKGTTPNNPKNNHILAYAGGERFVDNLLPDHSFENSTTSWTKYSSAGTAAVASGTAYLGTKAYKITQNASTPEFVGGYAQINNITANKTYTISGYFKTQSMSADGACFAIQCFDSTNTRITTLYSNKLGNTNTTANNGWEQLVYSFSTPVNTTYIRVLIGLNKVNGTMWADMLQLESTIIANSYNLAVNGGLTGNATGWTLSNATHSNSYVTATGAPTTTATISQNIYINKKATAVHISARGKANAITEQTFCLNTDIYFTDGTNETGHKAHFNPDTAQWQYISYVVKPKDTNSAKTISYIKLTAQYSAQANLGYFDNFMVTLDETGTSYDYDNKGNLNSAKDNAERNEAYQYNAANAVTQTTNTNNESYTYAYHQATDHPQLPTAISSVQRSNGYRIVYTPTGQPEVIHIAEFTGIGMHSDRPYISTYTTYNTTGNYVATQSDDRGNYTTYNQNPTTGRLNSVTDPKGNTTTYGYNTDDYITSISAAGSGGTSTINYAYDTNKRLANITHNGFQYGFTYDQWGNTVATTVAGTTLASNTYKANNGPIDRTTYANGAYISYTYDTYNRLTNKKASNTTGVSETNLDSYAYNYKGQLGRYIDYGSGNTVTNHYTYDLIGRLTQDTRSNGQNFKYAYDNMNRPTHVEYYDNSTTPKKTTYTYLADSLPNITTFYNASRYKHNYDNLNRTTSTQTYPTAGNDDLYMQHMYTYLTISGNRQSSLPYRETFRFYPSPTNILDFDYIYDQNGNITRKYDRVTGEYTYYTYDGLNQLIREDDQTQNTTTTWTYDTAGNILNRKTYIYTTGTVGTVLTTDTYTYPATGWKDLLVGYNGQTITYDTIGNPLTYRDGIIMTWQQGRQLKTLTKSGTTNTYTYYASGLRESKTTGGIKTSFIYNGGQLVKSSNTSQTIYFLYEGNTPIGFVYNGTNYYYITNMAGDIIGLTDANMNIIARYTYDAWGKPLTVTDANGNTISSSTHIANINPLRYRGYYYDTETGLYYLNSRYYDPCTGRFINADVLLDTDEILGMNLFAYCGNNPVNNCDPTGTCFIKNGGYGPCNCDECTHDKDDEDTYVYMFSPHSKITPSKWDKHSGKRSGDPERGDFKRMPNPNPKKVKNPPKKPKNPKNPGKKKIELEIPKKGNVLTQEKNNDIGKNVAIVAGTVTGGYLIYTGIKWLCAGLLAIPTGGTSLAVAGCIP